METYGSAEFIGQLIDTANSTLPYIGGAVGAGVILLVVSWGVVAGLRAINAAQRADDAYMADLYEFDSTRR